MNNFRIDVTAEGDKSLIAAMKIAFAHNAPGGMADAYLIGEGLGLVFAWAAKEPGFQQLPFKMDPEGAADFARRWLAEQPYGKQPDHDGDNHKGWRVYCDAWGHVGPHRYAIVAVQPAWACYGK